MLDWFWTGFGASLFALASLLLERAITRDGDEDQTTAAARRAVLHPERDGPAPRTDLDALLRRRPSVGEGMDEPRRAAGAVEVRGEGGEGTDFFGALIAQSSSATEDGLRRPAVFSVPAPTLAERGALPIGSLPHVWLQLTSAMRRHEPGLYLDGVAMLLELSLRGLLDVPPVAGSRGRSTSGSDVVVGAALTGNAALDGARERLRSFGEPLDAEGAAVRVAPYVAALVVPSVGVEQTRARVTEAVVGDGARDVRIALVVWMLKRDVALGDFVRKVIFPGPTAVSRRALRRVRPNFYALTEHETAATAHRVLFATIYPRGALAQPSSSPRRTA